MYNALIGKGLNASTLKCFGQRMIREDHFLTLLDHDRVCLQQEMKVLHRSVATCVAGDSVELDV